MGAEPQRDPRAQPLVGDQGVRTPDAENFWFIFIQKRGQNTVKVQDLNDNSPRV